MLVKLERHILIPLALTFPFLELEHCNEGRFAQIYSMQLRTFMLGILISSGTLV